MEPPEIVPWSAKAYIGEDITLPFVRDTYDRMDLHKANYPKYLKFTLTPVHYSMSFDSMVGIENRVLWNRFHPPLHFSCNYNIVIFYDTAFSSSPLPSCLPPPKPSPPSQLSRQCSCLYLITTNLG